MILTAYQTFAMEPWCWEPGRIASLTDWQIEHLYFRPTIERSAQEGDAGGEVRREIQDSVAASPASEAHAPNPDRPMPRAYLAGVMTGYLGMSVEDANREYDRQLAEWTAARSSRP